MKSYKILFLFLAVILLAGCDWFNKTTPPPNAEPDAEPDPDPIVVIEPLTAYIFIDELEEHLSQTGIMSVSYVEIVGNNARSIVGDDTTDVNSSIEMIIEGAIQALGEITLSSDVRLQAIEEILTSIMSSLEEHKADVLTADSRAIDPYASAMNQLLAQISAAAVRNLSHAGLAADEIAGGATKTVTALIGALDEGGVQAEEVPSFIQVITQSAVKSITQNTGATTSEVILQATKSITLGAVTAIDDIEVDGFNKTQVPDVIGGITRGATMAIGSIADDMAGGSGMTAADAIGDLSSEIAASVLSGADTLEYLSSGDLSEVVGMVTESSIEAVAGLAFSGVSTDSVNDSTRDILRKITKATSTAANSMTILVDSDREAVLTAIVSGASDGAQDMHQDFNQAELELLIMIDDDGDASTDAVALADILDDGLKSSMLDAVTVGIEKADNSPPVADAGMNILDVDVLEAVFLDGSGSFDPDAGSGDSIIKYYWFIVDLPEGSTSSELYQESTTESNAEFVADVAGDYTLGLQVTDSRGDYDSNYLTVSVKLPPSAQTYDGKTAQERLDGAILLRTDGEDPGAALLELKKITTYYPVTDIFSTVYMETGLCLDSLGQYDEAVVFYNRVRTEYASSDDYPEAVIHLAWIYFWNYRNTDKEDIDLAFTYFTELTGSAYSTTKYVAFALSGMGSYYSRNEEWSLARTKFNEALTHPYITNSEKFWSRYHIGETYEGTNDWDGAIAEYQTILDNSIYTQKDEGGVDEWKIFKAHERIAHVYEQTGNQTAEIAEWQKVIDNTGLSGWFRGWASCNLGNIHQNNGEDAEFLSDAILGFEASESAYINAYNLAEEDDPNTAWGYSSLMWTYKAWMVRLINEDEDHAAIFTKFINIRTMILTSGGDYPRQQIAAYMSYADYFAWDKPDRTDSDLFTAIDSAKSALYIAESRNLSEELWCRRHLAYFYQDLGWRNREEYGVNWRSYFYTAIEYVKEITIEKFPGQGEDVARVERIIADSYSGLKEYNFAIDYSEGILGSIPSYYSPERVAELWQSLVDIYNDKGNYYYHDRDEYDAAEESFNSTIIKGIEALAYLDNNGGVIDSEDERRDRLNRLIGGTYLTLGWLYRDELDDEVVAAGKFTAAIEYLEEVSDSGDSGDYYWALRDIADAKLGLYDYNGAREAYDSILEIIDDFDPDDKGRTIVDRANTYDQEFGDYDWENPTGDVKSELDGLYNEGEPAYVSAISELTSDGNSEFICRIHRDFGNYTSQYAHALFWAGEDLITLSQFNTLMDSAIDHFILAAGVDNDFEDYGQETGEARNEAGFACIDKAHRYGEWYEWNEEKGYLVAEYRGLLDDSFPHFEAVLDSLNTVSMDIDTYLDSKLGIVNSSLDMVYTYDFEMDEFGDYSDHLATAFTYLFEIIAEPDLNDWQGVDSLRNMARFNRMMNGKTVTLATGDYTFSYEQAHTLCDWVINEFSHMDDGTQAAEAQQEKGLIERDKARDARDGTIPDSNSAITFFQSAIIELEKVEPYEDGFSDDQHWIIDQAVNEKIDCYMELGDVYQARGDLGDDELALAAYTWVVTHGEYRADEAQSRIDEM
ncbi:MAG: tetratricopeptide repeat protein [Spirochaetales bacterium]|nr:tetratricopeptide repeat protein [Spirochaetales bacterium]